ncbi:fimbrial protein [Escherichia coli]|uniref:fimbrial protein n=1 Tax=Escherichia coli TaxID=562 RepID=UPI000D1584B9|nr:fimbrial protein [Escherichia coli]EFA4228979.1 fimbrial protein [Escherichia coli O11:H15]EGK4049316.1 fimbrial protein [Escherichia coli]EGK4058718.1 fimbrial protein [Escherichia coli]EHR8424947.1 fimbrial protein [Escherichia coli]EII3576107.1 fimbrial protein [Escherichia coli]
MRKIQFILGILAAASSSATLAYDGTINFTGKVVAQTCSVSSGSKNLTVTLPTVSEASLAAATNTAGLTPFTIELTGCNTSAASGAQSVKAYFEPNATTDYDTGNLNITASGANNVQIQLLNADGVTPIKLGQDATGQNVTAVQIGNAAMKLRYNAQYYATAQATAGDVSATVNYTIAYQ